MEKPIALIWYRLDLRVNDHAPLTAALERGFLPVPVFIWAPEEEAPWVPGAASRRWLQDALADFDARLRRLGSRLVLRSGPTEATLLALFQETGARAAYWQRRHEPAVVSRDARLETRLRALGFETEVFPGDCLFEPGSVLNKSGEPFRVFTPFWNRCLALPVAPPLPAPDSLPACPRGLRSEPLDSFSLRPSRPWDSGIAAAWDMTRAGAESRLRHFFDRLPDGVRPVDTYEARRDIPGEDGTSRLSPYLHFGQLSVREAYAAARLAGGAGEGRFLAELGWREFGRHLLAAFPFMPERPLDASFERFPWSGGADLIEAWRRGRTGVPLVDAGMRQLWETGWMHNRVRMVAGSFLVKNLLADWREGERWFWDTLVDADLAQNSLGWQWVAGCGADAAPYFRIFNPVLQGERFDPAGVFVRKFVPELSQVAPKWVHRPREVPGELFAPPAGAAYPPPLVGLSLSRARALSAYARRNG